MRPIARLAIVVGVQLLIVVGLIGFKQYTLWTADDVLLRVQTGDPRDLVGSRAAPVRYEISELDLNELAGDRDVFAMAWVELQEQPDGYWQAVAVHGDGGERSFDGTVLLKGEIRDYRFGSARGEPTIVVAYGIEDVFIASGDGVPSGDGHDVAMKVAVDRWGEGIPRDFYIDGERFDLTRR